MRLKINAQKNPSTLMPSINLSAMIMMSALMTKRNKPSVKTVMGRVNNISKGFTRTFKTANTIAKMTAVLKSAICTPVKMDDNP